MNKETFIIYETIRRSGATNMFDVKKVIELSDNKLTEEDCLDIMENYSEYEGEFNKE